MGLDFVRASTGGMLSELAYETLELQFRFSLLTANDIFFITEVVWVQIVISVDYGFRTNRSTEEAILDLLDKINSTKNSNQHALRFSLDIKGTFDHLQYTSIKNSLDNLKYHSNTLETLIDILSNRKVAINTSQGPATWNQQRGYPKASAQDLLSGTW
ncbi:hypothetical protein AVEN_241330-1 [Araneus ventricosus]|uniref:Uncharacterized protein n=1 Tax=Araneus ventricosus TaxID=182803 RepID=A0A4Y2EFQ5_ARAVE|nr:hypothetical protein AVEN_241330-1 [Araneus ventricosus]